MRKLYILLALALAPLAALLAQPTINIDSGSTCTNENICLPVTTRDFTNINALGFDFGYDNTVLSFTGAQNFNTDLGGNMGPALFNEAVAGTISFGLWEVGECDNPTNFGVTLEDEVTLFELCFDAIGDYGEQTNININPAPTPICFRNATGCNSIGVFINPGEVTLCVREFTVTAADISGNEGDFVCVDFSVDGFDDLNGIQFSVNYDPAFLQFENLTPNTDIPANNVGSYGTPPGVSDGVITVAWNFPEIPGGPASTSVDDGTNMFTACFTILGECETNSTITFSGDPTPIEANNTDPDNPDDSMVIPFDFNEGAVTVNDCDPEGIEIIVDCGDPVNLNDQVCVQVLAGSNFDAVRRMDYLMTWNPNILQFSNTQSFNLSGLNAVDFDSTNAANGILGLEWEFNAGPAQNLNNMELIYEVCFDVIGVGGNSPIQIITPGIGVSNGINIGINPTNCTVEVNQPESVVLEFGDIAVPLNTTNTCVPVTVSNFNDVTEMQFTANWDEINWVYTGSVQGINPALVGASPTFVPLGSTSLGFTMDNNGTGITLADGSTLFEICFDTSADAVPGACTAIETVGLPFPETAITENSNGDNIGIIVAPGEMCVLFPEGFGLTIENTTGGWLETVCVPFTVESFDNITAAEFLVSWNPTELDFVSATALAWTDLMITPPAPPGTVGGSFSSTVPLAIPDGEVAFEVCFELIGDPNECYDVSIVTPPAPEVQTSNGQGSMVITNGEVCVEERIVVTNVEVTPPSCPDACDGMIQLEVATWDGQGFIGTTWNTESPTFQQNTPLFLEDVCTGQTIFTVFDNLSGVSYTDTLIIESDGVVPVAEINGDEVRELDCNGGLVLSCNSTGQVTNAWYQNTVSPSTLVGTGNTLFVNGPGIYVKETIDQVSGCSSTDTVTVITSQTFPEVCLTAETTSFTCMTDSITLDASCSTGDNLIYTWCRNGVDIISGPDATFEAMAPGTYTVKLQNSVTGCISNPGDTNGTVGINDDRVYPTACALEVNGGSSTQEQNCDGTGITFSADCSDTDGLLPTYTWFEATADSILTNEGEQALESTFSDIGVYAIEVFSELSGCADTSFVRIIPNSGAPQVAINDPGELDCSTESLTLTGSYSPNDPSYTFEWILTEGASLSDSNSLTTEALTPGIYQLQVTDPISMCVGDSTLVIEDLTETPFVEISNNPDSVFINCVIPSRLLNGTTSDDDLVYQWCNADGEIIGASQDTLTVIDEGWYYLKGTNVATSCVGVDSIFVAENFETPQVILDILEGQLDCNNEELTITATIGNDVTDFSVGQWVSDPSEAINSATIDAMNPLIITVREEGTYNIQVASNTSGCIGEADAVIVENFVEPMIDVVDDTLTINCLETFVTLSGAGSAMGQDFVYNWNNTTGPGQAIPQDVIQTTTSFEGEYVFTVTDLSNGCFSDTLVVVQLDTISPMASIEPINDLTCTNPTAEITVLVEGADEFTVTWTGDPVDPSPTNQATTTVAGAGLYTATISGPNGCPASATIEVGGDLEGPELTVDIPSGGFDCPDESILLDATASGNLSDFLDIAWFFEGTELTGENELTLDATSLGEYSLQAVGLNGCDGEVMVTVGAVADLTLPTLPELTLNPLGCDGTPVTIDASAAGNNVNITNSEWTGGAFTQQSDFVIDATEVGVYTLTITQGDLIAECVNSANYTVEADQNTPVVNVAQETLEAGCGEPVTLDGSASTPGTNAATYTWVALDGSPALDSGADMPVATASQAGSYQLFVAVSANGCVDSSNVVTVTFAFPDDANAGDDTDVCDDMGDLSGNLPAGAGVTGVWTTATGAIIDMPTEPLTMVSNLASGGNVFTWTLSATGCPDYSSDEVTIFRAAAPNANIDMLTLEEDELTGEINIVANDNLSNPNDFAITILTEPAFGMYDTMALANGNFIYTVMPGQFGPTTATYEVCSVACPDLCDITTIEILVPKGDDTFVPNTITPNGDGANDELIFDRLLFNSSEDFPDNELIIFNRWGDIIYQAKPYNNDWTGLNAEGQPVPEGTYYYVLRLNISQGEIIRGDITIIR